MSLIVLSLKSSSEFGVCPLCPDDNILEFIDASSFAKIDNEEAPIFDVADYGLVADLFQVLPELEEAL